MQITSYYENVSFRLEAINQIKKLKMFIVSLISIMRLHLSLKLSRKEQEIF
jgi:hypothetical protein